MSVFIHQDLSGVSALAACDTAVQSLQMDHGARRQEEQHQPRGGRRGAHDRYTSKEKAFIMCKDMIRMRTSDPNSLQL